MRPVPSAPPPRGRQPVATAAPVRNWAFSFRYWRQIENFGLDHCNPNWFVSLLRKLQDLGGEDIQAFMADGSRRDVWRFHDIDWTAKNIPIQQADLTWLPAQFRDNPTEYPVVQFQISMALGRVIGFFDDASVFNVLLLDPLHNMQPSHRFHYRVDPCSPLPCVYSQLLEDVRRVKATACPTPECPTFAALQGVPDANHSYSVSIIRLPDDLSGHVDALTADGKVSLQDVIERGLVSIWDEEKATRPHPTQRTP